MSQRTTLTARPSRTRRTWGALFGVVPDHGITRRASEVARIVLGALVVVLGAVGARNLRRAEILFHDFVHGLPDAVLDGMKVANGAGTLIALVVVALAALLSRRIRFIGGVAVAFALAAGLSVALQHLVDAPAAVAGTPGTAPPYPDYPSFRLAVLAAVFFVAGPELTRPARRVQWVLLVVVALSVVGVTDGYPVGVLGSLALGWAVAALVHLAFGSPDGVPDPEAVRSDADDLGVALGPIARSASQVWGEQAFESTDDEGPVRVVVIGRDATDAQFLAKLFRFVWFKDSGSDLALTRPQQIQRRAYLLLLAERAGIAAPRVIADGAAGDKGDAMLLLRSVGGRPLGALDAGEATDDVLDAAWRALGELHALGIAHQGLGPESLALDVDGTLSFVDLATASASASANALLADQAALLVTLAVVADEDRAVDSAMRVLGPDALGEVLTVLQGPALPRSLRRQVHDVRHLTGRLRDAVAARSGVEAPKLVELHRVSIGNLLMAAGAGLGVYLLVGELAQVDYSAMVDEAEWVWLPVVILFSQLPQVGGAIAMLGSVAKPLPLTPVIGVQFANNFTGLVGGTVATLALVVRFFQRQGLSPAVAVSSGVINTIGAIVCQTILVVIGLAVTWGDYTFSRGGGTTSGGTFLTIVIVLAVVVGLALLVPRVRTKVRTTVGPQLAKAWENLHDVLRTPKKGIQLFGGNLIAQIFFAMTLWAALEMYGQSLGLMQLIVINSFASVLGGIAPVPGGMGVIEAGLIAGFTAAGVPQTEAVAATFTARMFTAYLPPIWGWFSLSWLRHKEYV